MCNRRKEKRAQREEERVQIISIEPQRMEERESYNEWEGEDNRSKRERG